MENGSVVVATVTFVTVILIIMTEKLNLTVAALLGALVLVFAHIMTLSEAMEYIGNSWGHAEIRVKRCKMVLEAIHSETFGNFVCRIFSLPSSPNYLL